MVRIAHGARGGSGDLPAQGTTSSACRSPVLPPCSRASLKCLQLLQLRQDSGLEEKTLHQNYCCTSEGEGDPWLVKAKSKNKTLISLRCLPAHAIHPPMLPQYILTEAS